jgi:uncharacterized protein YjdB
MKKKIIFLTVLIIILASPIIVNASTTGWKKIDNNWYYYDENSNMVTGWKKVDNYWYYLRKTTNDISKGPKGSMVTGYHKIEDDYFYLREKDNEISTGPLGSAVESKCAQIDGTKKCFAPGGTLVNQTLEEPIYNIEPTLKCQIQNNSDSDRDMSGVTFFDHYAVYATIISDDDLEATAKTAINLVDLNTNPCTLIDRNETIAMGHANDITKVGDKFYVTGKNENEVYEFSIVNNKIVINSTPITTTAISAIDYDPINNKYYIYRAKKLYKMNTLSGDNKSEIAFTPYYYKNFIVNDSSFNNLITQGIAYGNVYGKDNIYFTRTIGNEPFKNHSYILVYDVNSKKYKYSLKFSPGPDIYNAHLEGASIIGNKIYLGLTDITNKKQIFLVYDGLKEIEKKYTSTQDKTKVAYTTHVQNIGWQDYVKDGAMAGTSGKSLRLEGIRIKLDNQGYEGNILYKTHVQNEGWESSYKKDDEISGTQGKSYRLEAIKIKLTGSIKDYYDVYYRVHAENFGWLGWARNDEEAGTAGYSYRLEGIEIKLVPKGTSFPEYGKKEAYKDKNAASKDKLVGYTTHVQNIGWQKYVYDGAMAGTSGKSLRLEGIKIKLENQKYDGNILYRTHIQNIGWEKSFKKNNEMSGTEGKSYRLEGIEIKLDGGMKEHYDIYYRVHAENFGWLGWAKNGEQAGTAGYSYRLEGIEIKLVPKGEDFTEYGKKSAFKEKNSGITDYDPNDAKIKNLIDNLTVGTSPGTILELEFCNNKKVEAKDISTERAVKIASVVANKDNRETLTVTEMKNIVKKYLGKNYELNMNEVPRSTGHCGVMYYYDENKGLFIRANGGCGSTMFYPTRYKIVKAQDTNGTLKLDVKVVYTIISESNLSSYTVNFYSDYEKTKLINSKSATEEPCQTIACAEERQQQYQASIEQDYKFDKGSTYQFTFKSENGNYVFVSSEKK